MSESIPRHSTRPDARLTRRSLVAAAGVLAAVGPVAASKALAFSSSKAPKFNWTGGENCQTKCALCFLRGTRLLTPDGEVAIEALKIGDVVTTHGGETRAVRWVGRIEISRAEGWDRDVLPVRISKDALGRGVPQRDLYVSRAHMLYLNGVLVPVADLINGATIAIVSPDVETLQYFHIELGSHDVVVAEGAPCESLLATPTSLKAFDNHAEYEAFCGHLPPLDARPYAPIAAYNGGRGELKSRLRSALAPVVDIRRPLDVVRDNIEARALLSKAA